MLAIEVTGGPADAEAVAAACQVWLGATSLGGVESQIERRRRYPGESPLVPDTLLRLSVGIEDVEDLWRDLEQASLRLA
jgi:cystathionine gamma-synthase